MPAKFAITDEVRDVLKKATIEPRAVILNGKLERGLYVQVDKVLKAAGGKWSRSDNAHIFSRDPREALGLAIETGVATNRQQELQAFYTPDPIADLVAERAEISTPVMKGLTIANGGPGATVSSPLVLEPSVGGGSLVRAVFRKNPFARVMAIDIDAQAIERLRGEQNPYVTCQVADFLTVKLAHEPGNGFDRIVMNPPFTKGQDIAHVLHAWTFLKPGGILVAIMSGNALTGNTKRHSKYRVLYKKHGVDVSSLPEAAFRSSGTDVRTIIVKLRAPA